MQAGDGYLAGLAARFSSELNVDEDDVLHQLEDLRSAATSGWTTTRGRRPSEEAAASVQQQHNYANYPGNPEDKNFMPGIYAVSSTFLEL